MICTALFEPWAFGDAIIAASFLRHVDVKIGLVCDTRWIRIIRHALPDVEKSRILGVHLDYTNRYSQDAKYNDETADLFQGITTIYSIRGDVRDFLSAKKIFSNARIKMIGWIPFLAWHLRIIDLPFSLGIIKIKNRYSLWSELLSVSVANPTTTHFQGIKNRKHPVIVIHIGAQWNSKRYPYVRKLQEFLLFENCKVNLIMGPNDRIPEDFKESDLIRAQDEELINKLRSADLFVTNDSGPMHLAALMGIHTLVIARASNILVWKAPNVHSIYSECMPKGYAPDRLYDSDKVLSGWPSPEVLMTKIRNLLRK